jgi:hypothetical protein
MLDTDEASPAAAQNWRRYLTPGRVVVLLFFVVLGVSFALPKDVTLGAPDTDLIGQFVAWRAYAADSLRQGDLPFWNPYTFAGQPFFGGFQSALFYPPNLAFLILPLGRAFTFSILAHLIVLGWGVGTWARWRGCTWPAAALAGFIFPLSGVVFPHVYAGHYSNICTMSWAPWTFLGLELWNRDRKLKGLLLGSFAVCLQILGGQMQYVFFLGVAAGLHGLLNALVDRAARWRALSGVAIVYLGAAALAAAQLLPGLSATAEGVRQGKLDYAFASSFALPPENLLTAFVPGFLGDGGGNAQQYWGRGYAWEMSLFVGVAAVFLAFAAIINGPRARLSRLDLGIVAFLLVLALGRHLPIYAVLYHYVPGFGQFRGMSKFSFPALLFFVMAVAAGIDELARGRLRAQPIGFIMLAAGTLCGVAGVVLWLQPRTVGDCFNWINMRASGELIAPPLFPDDAARTALFAILRSAIICVLAGGCLLLSNSRRRFGWAFLALLALDVGQYAARQLGTVSTSLAMPNELRDFVAQNPGDYRVLNILRPNSGYLLGASDLWGNDPGVLKRYAEFMTFTQGGDPNRATQNLIFSTIPPIYSMLRCRYAFVPTDVGVDVKEVPNPMPRASLITNYQVLYNRDDIFAVLGSSQFDPRKTVILEQEPDPKPQSDAQPGIARTLETTNDTLKVEVESTAPALLLITDIFSRDWRIRALPGSKQAKYNIVPANYILRTVPLEAGHHVLQFEYVPRSFTLGIAISAVAWLVWLTSAVLIGRGANH